MSVCKIGINFLMFLCFTVNGKGLTVNAIQSSEKLLSKSIPIFRKNRPIFVNSTHFLKIELIFLKNLSFLMSFRIVLYKVVLF